VEFVAYLKPFI
jgi:hypothetical protein